MIFTNIHKIQGEVALLFGRFTFAKRLEAGEEEVFGLCG